jgi:hypothetical protein
LAVETPRARFFGPSGAENTLAPSLRGVFLKRMGFFDRFSGKKPDSGESVPRSPAAPPPAVVVVEPSETVPAAPAKSEAAVESASPRPASAPTQPTTVSRLRAAREKLDAKDVKGALAIYEEVLAVAGDRADVLVTVSGDLGSTGHATRVVELIAPRYDAVRHGPAAGLNVLQAYIAIRDTDSAQHILDILFSLNRPDLEERLYGFSNAISEILLQGDTVVVRAAPEGDVGGEEPGEAEAAANQASKVAIVTISKPVWFYGLEALGDRILPPKNGKLRRIAFTQLGLPDTSPDLAAEIRKPEDELGRLSRALPAWLTEVFYYSPLYAPMAAVAFVDEPGGSRFPMRFPSEWSMEHLRQMADTTSENVDYAVTGTLRHRAGDYELALRVWEMKKFRERKQFVARWAPATADLELGRLRDAVCQYMECVPASGVPGIPYSAPSSPRAWLDALGASLSLFLGEKGLFPKETMASAELLAAYASKLAAESPAASFAWLTFVRRCRASGIDVGAASVRLNDSPLVAEAEALR